MPFHNPEDSPIIAPVIIPAGRHRILPENIPGNASKVMTRHIDACKAVSYCLSNLEVVYRNWAIDSQNVGDWQTARQALQACVAQLPGDAICSHDLADLESRHRF